jgi:hypothetical protein
MLPFADLTQITIVRPSHGSTNETRRVVNLLNSANEIDVAKDVTLEFGDVIEIPERDHALGENSSGLTDTQRGALANYVKGVAKLTAHGQEIELPFSRLDGQATVGTVLNSGEARQLLLASSDLSRVKVTRRDAKTGQKREWIFDCRQKAASPNGTSALSYQWNLTFAGSGNGASSPTIQDLWLQNGDAIEVPEKP